MDKYHRAHDVPNLFVMDGSNFVTSARNHPTCTIAELAVHASDHIIKTDEEWRIKPRRVYADALGVDGPT